MSGCFDYTQEDYFKIFANRYTEKQTSSLKSVKQIIQIFRNCGTVKETSSEAGDSVNVALSTYTVWALLTLMAEGARENTLKQLESSLKLSPNKEVQRKSFQNLTRLFLMKRSSVDLEYNMAVFHNRNFPVKEAFGDVAKNVYGVDILSVDFTNATNAVSTINKYVSSATMQRIPRFVNEDDVTNAHVFLTSVLYFKGQWKWPFNTNSTRKETFFDEKGNKLGEVDMMFQIGVFPYARLEDIGSYAVELPYGDDRKMAMILILPFKGGSLSRVLNLLSNKPFSTIIQALENSEKEFSDEDIYLYVPKFKISSDFNLNVVLRKIGVKDVFDIDKANLLDMFDQYLYLSRLIQRTEIEVDEEGTAASSAAGAAFPNKSAPPKFRANRPFLYFIIEKPTKSILFAGKIVDPKSFL